MKNQVTDTYIVTSSGVSTTDMTVNYAGYVSASSVSSHAGIDYDQEALMGSDGCEFGFADMTAYLDSGNTYSDRFECAKDIYENGQGAGTSNPSSSRTLQGTFAFAGMSWRSGVADLTQAA